MIYEVIIVGGGLSGLVLAKRIQETNPSIKWILFEASSSLGGRIFQNPDCIDLGGAWIWPSHNPLMSSLVKSLDIDTFKQPDAQYGDTSTRIVGGAQQIIAKLLEVLPKDNIKTEHEVTECTLDPQISKNKQDITSPAKIDSPKNANNISEMPQSLITLTLKSGERIKAKRVVLAAPPRILHKRIRFNPPLDEMKLLAMMNCRTWMAGVTKVALIYPYRFWPLDGISNSGLGSGPAFQVYDGSSFDQMTCALTFFTLASCDDDTSQKDEDKLLAGQCAQQLSNLWKNIGLYDLAMKVLEYRSYHVKNWSKEIFISDELCPTRIHPHPSPNNLLVRPEWEEKVFFAGTENDLDHPGFMEGAIGSALRVLQQMRLSSAS